LNGLEAENENNHSKKWKNSWLLFCCIRLFWLFKLQAKNACNNYNSLGTDSQTY